MSALDLQPTLLGETITLRPLAQEDLDALHAAASDPAVWEQHPDTQRFRREVFEVRFFKSAMESGGAFAVVENDSGRIVGSSRFYDYDPEKREVAIGYTFIERGHWGGATNREMKALMLNHAFAEVDRVWFHVGETNLRSRRAVEKLGAVLSHSEDRELEGKPFVQLFYELDPDGYRAAVASSQLPEESVVFPPTQ